MTIVGGVIKKVPRSQFGNNLNFGYGLNNTAGNISVDTTLIATKAFTNTKANKLQKVFYADDYVDEFTGWATDSLNHGSAIWKILSANNFKDVKIIFSAKTYVPWMGPVSVKKITNVSFEGISMPSFAQDLQHLQNGTILQGTWRLIQPTNDFSMSNIGIDVGKDVTDLYYGGVSVEGFTNSYRLGVDLVWGRNRVYKNISVLMRNPNDPVHAFLEERGYGVYIDNVRLCFGYHGLTLKSRDINVISSEAYGQGAENLIIKAGEVDTNTGNIYVGSFTSGMAPPEVSNSYVSIPKSQFGVYFDAQLPLTNINIGSLNISYAEHGLEFSSKSGNVIGLVNIQSATINGCNYGFVRSGAGKLSYVNISQLGVFGSTSAAVFLTEGTGIDSGIKLGTLTTGGNPVGTGVYMRNNTQLEIDSYMPNYVTNAIDINAGVNLKVNNYNIGESVTNYIAPGGLNPSATNVVKNADNAIPYPLTVLGGLVSISESFNSGVILGSESGVGVIQGRDYANTQAVPLTIQPFGIQPVYFGSLTPNGTSSKYQFNGGTISTSSLTGTGDSPIGVDASGTLKRITGGAYLDLTTDQTAAGLKTFTQPFRVGSPTSNNLYIDPNPGGNVKIRSFNNGGNQALEYVGGEHIFDGQLTLLSNIAVPSYRANDFVINHENSAQKISLQNSGTNKLEVLSTGVKINNLAGVDDRPVFVDASGLLKISPGGSYVDLTSNQTIGGNKTFNGFSTFANASTTAFTLKTNSGISSPSGGDVNVVASGGKFLLASATGTMGFVIPTTGTLRDFTFPNKSGTVALIDDLTNLATKTQVFETSGTSAVLVNSGRYIPQNGALTIYTLPNTASVGDVIFINGKGAGGWRISQNTGQVIHGATDTTVGSAGFVASTARYNSIAIVCVTANTEWIIQSSQGSLTIN